MKIVTVNYNVPATVTVPDGCVAVVAFEAIGLIGDIIGADRIFRPINAVLSADPNVDWSQTAAGNSVVLLAVSNREFPKIPVSAGERLLVSFEDTGSAIIYFETAE